MNSKQKTPLPTIRYVVFGSTGVGKSTLGNVLLGIDAFKTSDSFESCTKEPFSHSNIVNGIKIIVTDTVGLNDPEFDDEQVLKDLASYFQNDFQGQINYFLLLQKFSERFTRDMFRNVHMLLTSFVGTVPKHNIKIVLTHAKGTPEYIEKKVAEFRGQMTKLFEKETSEIKEHVKNIPILLVNNHSKPAKRTPLPPDISPFQANPAPAIDPCKFSPKGYSLIEETIVEEGFIDKSTDDGIQIFATLVHRKRTKFTSFDKKSISYSDWENINGQEPRRLCIQNAEFGQKHEDEPEIKNETSGNEKIKRTIYHSFKDKRIKRIKFNKEEQQCEKKNSEVFNELTDTLNVDGRAIAFTESTIEKDITTFYSAWYPDPDSEIKYEIQEITRPFEKTEKNGSREVKFFGEEMRKLKIEYNKDQSGQWQKGQTKIEQEWFKTRTDQNITEKQTRNQESNEDQYLSNPTRHNHIHKTWQEECTVTFLNGYKQSQSMWIKIPGTEKTTITTKETQNRSQETDYYNITYSYYTKIETSYEALEHVKKTSYYKKYLEERIVTYINDEETYKTEWNKVSNSEDEFTKVELYEIKGTKDQYYIRKLNNGRGSSGTHYHYFGTNHYSPYYGLENRYIRRVYKNGSSSPIDEYIGDWAKLILVDDTERWQCIESGISGNIRKL